MQQIAQMQSPKPPQISQTSTTQPLTNSGNEPASNLNSQQIPEQPTTSTPPQATSEDISSFAAPVPFPWNKD